MSMRPRPLSPHLQVYRFQWTMLLSITHRLTGIALALGAVLLVWWLTALALGAEYYAMAQDLLGSWVGRILLLGWTWSVFYHFCNGIRHLAWDVGWGFDLGVARASGWAVVILSAALTLVLWATAYSARGI